MLGRPAGAQVAELQGIVEAYFTSMQSLQRLCTRCKSTAKLDDRDDSVLAGPLDGRGKVTVVIPKRLLGGDGRKDLTPVVPTGETLTVPHSADLANDATHAATRRIVAMICHLGLHVGGGHYIAYVKRGNSWWCCNDTSVREVVGGIDTVRQQLIERAPRGETLVAALFAWSPPNP